MQCIFCDVQKLLGMRKMVATFYWHCLKTGLKREWQRGESGTVECSNHFAHTQQFLYIAKNTLGMTDSVEEKPADFPN